MEAPLKYRPCYLRNLTAVRNPDPGHCLVGSLTGAVASQSVTEARNGELRLVGNQPLERNGTSSPDCEPDGASRDESRS